MQEPQPSLRIAVVGHVEHVVISPVPVLPGVGEIAHLGETMWIPGGGGGIAYYQLLKSPAELHLFTALGNDDAGEQVSERIHASRGIIHAVRRPLPHTRDVVLITPGGERTILVMGEPLHPQLDDPLPWDLLETCRAVYFTAQDPKGLRAARAADLLVVTSRRATALALSGVQADVVVGSAEDPRETSHLADYAIPPRALVMTEGSTGGFIETAQGGRRFSAPPSPFTRKGAYGAGDSFAGALTWYLACGLSTEHACARAGFHGAAVLGGLSPLEHQLPLEWPDTVQASQES
jgi:ribokinase